MNIHFSSNAWKDYLYWQARDKRMVKRINMLIKEIQRSPQDGIGKPEKLKHSLSGYWSRRIDGEHRIVYRYKDDILLIAQLRYHYEVNR